MAKRPASIRSLRKLKREIDIGSSPFAASKNRSSSTAHKIDVPCGGWFTDFRDFSPQPGPRLVPKLCLGTHRPEALLRVSEPVENDASCLSRCLTKQSFVPLRSQAELGNEERRALRRMVHGF